MVSTTTKKSTKKILKNRFQIIEALSSGGMSRTYLAKDIEQGFDSKCVIKELKPLNSNIETSAKLKDLFEKEAKALEKLGHHDQIPSLITYFEEDQIFYLVQQFVEGCSLLRKMPLGKRWSEDQTKDFLKEVLFILEYVHKQNVIHLDVKPANIIRRQVDQKPVLIDFGAVKKINSESTEPAPLGKTQSTVLTCIGTKGYMPTEQLTGNPNPSSDIYALGMTAIQALTGILPLQLKEEMDGEIAWISQAEVSDDLARILTKMVKRYYRQRYQSATEVLKDIRNLERQADLKLEVCEDAINEAPPSKPYHIPSTEYSFSDELEDLWREEATSAYDSGADIPTSPNQAATFTTEGKNDSPDEDVAKINTKRNRFLFQGGMALLVTSLLAVGVGLSVREHRRDNQKALLKEIEFLKDQGESKECINTAVKFPERFSALHDKSTNLIDTCSRQLVEEAKELAENDQIVSAVSLIGHVPEEAEEVYKEVKSLAQAWHLEVIERAQNQYKQCVIQNGDNGFDIAISWVGAIPSDSSVYSDAQASSKTWHQEWSNNMELLDDAEKILINDESLKLAESNIDASSLSTAKENIQASQNTANSAREKISGVRILGQSISESHQCFNLPEFKAVTRLIIEKESKIASLQIRINDLEMLGHLRARNPLNVTGNLAQGAAGVSTLAEEGVLRRDHEVRGQEGDRWSISMRSPDFDTRIFLIDPDGHVIRGDDDSGDGYNSYIPTVTLPKTGIYRVRASSYDPPPYGQGNYELIVTKFDG